MATRARPPAGRSNAAPAPQSPPTQDANSPNFDWNAAGFEQMRQLQQINQELLVRLDQVEAELLAGKSGGGAAAAHYGTDPRDQRIVELTKKNRVLTASLQKERATSARLQAELASLRKQTGQGAPAPEPDTSNGDGASPEEAAAAEESEVARLEAELNDARTKLEQTKVKVIEMRNNEQLVRADLAKAHRALVREVGEDVALSRILDEKGTWKGRAETIVMQKNQIQQLKKQLAEGSFASPQSPSTTQQFNTMASGTGRPDIDQKQQAVIQQKVMERKQTVEELSAQLEATKLEVADWKKRCAALSSRNKSADATLKELRYKMSIVLDKTAGDDELIQSLQLEINKYRGGGSRGSATTDGDLQTPHSTAGGVGYSYDELKLISSEQEKQIERQNRLILQLQKTSTDVGGGLSASNAQQLIAAAEKRAQSMEVELQKMKELVEMYKRQLDDANGRKTARQLNQEEVDEIGEMRTMVEKAVALREDEVTRYKNISTEQKAALEAAWAQIKGLETLRADLTRENGEIKKLYNAALMKQQQLQGGNGVTSPPATAQPTSAAASNTASTATAQPATKAKTGSAK